MVAIAQQQQELGLAKIGVESEPGVPLCMHIYRAYVLTMHQLPFKQA